MLRSFLCIQRSQCCCGLVAAVITQELPQPNQELEVPGFLHVVFRDFMLQDEHGVSSSSWTEVLVVALSSECRSWGLCTCLADCLDPTDIQA